MKKTGFLAAAFLTGTFHEAIAQGCSVCTQTAAGLGASSAQGLNSGILYLASIPLLFMGPVGFIWYRRSKASATEQ